jgi:hypothetical protein
MTNTKTPCGTSSSGTVCLTPRAGNEKLCPDCNAGRNEKGLENALRDIFVLLQEARELREGGFFEAADKEHQARCKLSNLIDGVVIDQVSVGSGAIYDFMGWLTTRTDRLVLSASDNAGPAADAVQEFLNLRGISPEVEPRIKDWNGVAA